jgi:hypothetical protein
VPCGLLLPSRRLHKVSTSLPVVDDVVDDDDNDGGGGYDDDERKRAENM